MRKHDEKDGKATAKASGELMRKPKSASVIPPKRKLVKTMMLESIVRSCFCLFSSCGEDPEPSNATSCRNMLKPRKPKSAKGKNGVFPDDP